MAGLKDLLKIREHVRFEHSHLNNKLLSFIKPY